MKMRKGETINYKKLQGQTIKNYPTTINMHATINKLSNNYRKTIKATKTLQNYKYTIIL